MDDDADFLNSLADLLQIKGYQVLKASTIEETRQILEDKWIHLIIVDLSMTGEDQDKSGLLIINEPAYKAIPKVILTGSDHEVKLVRETLRPTPDGRSPAVDFLWKLDEDRFERLTAAFDAHVHINWALNIRWSSPSLISFNHLASLVLPASDMPRLDSRADELEDLFRKLFFDDKQLIMGRLLAQNEGMAWLELFALGDSRQEEQVLVCFGQRQLVHKEMSCFYKFAPKGSKIGNTARVKTEETTRFAAVVYEPVGGNLEEMLSFGACYERWPADNVIITLEQLFRNILSSWHKQKSVAKEIVNLNNFYAAWLGPGQNRLNPAELEEKLADLCAASSGLPRLDYSSEEVTLCLPDSAPVSYPNPIAFLSDTAISLDTSTLYGVVHGQLHPRNILVDPQRHTWLIDFSQAHQGLVARDFVTMELAVKVELVSTLDIVARYEIEKRLLAISYLGEAIEADGPEFEVQKTVRVISYIRQSAAATVGHNLNVYLAGLVFCALERLATYNPQMPYIRRELVPYLHTLLSAAMIYQRLTPPREFTFDPARRVVTVEGKQFEAGHFTAQEWDILAFLHSRANEYCTYQDFLKKIFNDPDESINDGAWLRRSGKPKVNQAIGRIRKKLERFPDNPKYIINVRELGYKLKL
jgi:DNA-binding response OmpR family regulator